MPDNNTADRTASADEQAEDRTRETQSFMRSVRRATRRKYTPEEKIRIVLEGFRREATVNDLCRREGINPANYYPSSSSGRRSWTKDPSTLRRECVWFRSEGADPNLRWLRALSLTCRPLAALRGLT